MEITSCGDALFITASWGSSAFETHEWTMTGIYNPATGKYHYNDCVSKLRTSDANGHDVTIINYVNGTGAVYIATNGYLYWEDYAEQAVIFIPAPPRARTGAVSIRTPGTWAAPESAPTFRAREK